MPEIKLTHVTKRWGKFYAVDDLSLDMETIPLSLCLVPPVAVRPLPYV